PFEALDGVSLMYKHVNEKVPRLPTAELQTGAESKALQHLQSMLDKCLAKDPKARYENMTLLNEELRLCAIEWTSLNQPELTLVKPGNTTESSACKQSG